MVPHRPTQLADDDDDDVTAFCYCVVLVFTGLGHVVPELGVKEEKTFPKTCFSMVLPEVEEYMKQCGGKIPVQLFCS